MSALVEASRMWREVPAPRRGDIVRHIVDEHALFRGNSHQVERVFEDRALWFAHAHLARYDDRIEHVVPTVAGIVIAPRVRQQRSANSTLTRATDQPIHVLRMFEVVKHPG